MPPQFEDTGERQPSDFSQIESGELPSAPPPPMGPPTPPPVAPQPSRLQLLGRLFSDPAFIAGLSQIAAAKAGGRYGGYLGQGINEGFQTSLANQRLREKSALEQAKEQRAIEEEQRKQDALNQLVAYRQEEQRRKTIAGVMVEIEKELSSGTVDPSDTVAVSDSAIARAKAVGLTDADAMKAAQFALRRASLRKPEPLFYVDEDASGNPQIIPKEQLDKRMEIFGGTPKDWGITSTALPRAEALKIYTQKSTAERQRPQLDWTFDVTKNANVLARKEDIAANPDRYHKPEDTGAKETLYDARARDLHPGQPLTYAERLQVDADQEEQKARIGAKYRAPEVSDTEAKWLLDRVHAGDLTESGAKALPIEKKRRLFADMAENKEWFQPELTPEGAKRLAGIQPMIERMTRLLDRLDLTESGKPVVPGSREKALKEDNSFAYLTLPRTLYGMGHAPDRDKIANEISELEQLRIQAPLMTLQTGSAGRAAWPFIKMTQQHVIYPLIDSPYQWHSKLTTAVRNYEIQKNWINHYMVKGKTAEPNRPTVYDPLEAFK